MEECIIKCLEEIKFTYIKINNKQSIKKIYDLYFNDKEGKCETDIEFLYFGVYYYIHKNTDNMMKYYMLAIEKENSCAMYNLGNYYKKQKDYDNMMKYYMLAIEKGNSYAMCDLGIYYCKQKDYDNMMKYYIMGAKNGQMNCITQIQENLDDLKKWGMIGYSFFIKCIMWLTYDQIKHLNKLHYKKVLCQITTKIKINEMKFKPKCMGAIASSIDFKLAIGDDKTKLFNKYKNVQNNRLSIIDYLGIKNGDDLEDKINLFIN